MTVGDSSLTFWVLMVVVFWAAALGAIAILATWTLILIGSTPRTIRETGFYTVDAPPGAYKVSEPAEEGGRLDEWSRERLDRAA